MKHPAAFANPFSFVFGLLCLVVVYLHSSWANGFDVSSMGLESHLAHQLGDLILLSAVPSFFICWGYLARKYLYDPVPATAFLKRKLIQFYPIYGISLILTLALNPALLDRGLVKLSAILAGVYYESGFTGGNIYMVVLFVLVTLSLFKSACIQRRGLFCWLLFCLVTAKLLPHQSRLCYVQYFGYYTAFWLGMALGEINYFSSTPDRRARQVFTLVMVIGILVPLLNKFGIYAVEIQYQPNSPEQLVFSLLILSVTLGLVRRLRLHQRSGPVVAFIHAIGNNAYRHFIIHGFVIKLILGFGHVLGLPPILVQCMIIATTSWITIHVLVPPIVKMEDRISRWGMPRPGRT